MKGDIFLTILILSSSVFTQDMKDMSVEELIKLAEQISQVRPKDVSEGDVKCYLFTRNTTRKLINLDDHTIIDPSKETKFIIHGWLENREREWYHAITEEYLTYGDFNIVQVDWERVARSSYKSSAQNTKLVGEIIADLILDKNLTLDSVHLIGHSLGAHVAAFAGQKIKQETGSRLKRITALDAAGPAFRDFKLTENDRLSSEDAKIVDAFHTDGGFYGFDTAIGTLDVYINGGRRIQPGCLEEWRIASLGDAIEKSINRLFNNARVNNLFAAFCSHASSTRYFIEIINKEKFTCVKCENWEKFVAGLCNSNPKYVFGAEDIDNTMTGSCYVQTGERFSSRIYQTLRNFLFNPNTRNNDFALI